MYSEIEEYIYCVDWGTSSLRIRLIDTKTNEILSQVKTSQGAYSVFDNWQKQLDYESTDSNRIAFFLGYLKNHLDKLKNTVQINTDKVPVIISGMASSSIGILELPYAELPFAIGGGNAVVHPVNRTPEFDHDVLILSGVRGDSDVMRGEETQLVGIASLASVIQDVSESVVLLPGTHSKHIYIRDGFAEKIETYVTGELFSILSKNGLLKESVQPPDDFTEEHLWKSAFIEGIKYSGETTLLQGLFKIRTNQLFNKLNKVQNYNYLSGLLIGHELRKLLNTDKQIVLCCEHNLYQQYKLALEQLGLKDRVYFVNPDLVSTATIKGQVMIAQKFLTQSRNNQIRHVGIR